MESPYATSYVSNIVAYILSSAPFPRYRGSLVKFWMSKEAASV